MPETSPASQPLCFVLMPFGRKPDGNGKIIDFDDVYFRLIRPAVEDAGLTPIRADEEKVGGIIHKPMFERLILCEYAVADLTTANANVFYELGIRHAVRPQSTVPIMAQGSRLPFDLGPIRTVPYELDGTGRPSDPDTDRETLTALLRAARAADVDSPLFQLVEGFQAPDISRLKTDVFRERVDYEESTKRKLAEARKTGETEIQAIAEELGPLADIEAGVLIDLLLSYRAVEAWGKMIELVENMPSPLASTTMVQEQLGLALNRAGQGDKAETVLKELIAQRGPSSETYGILGRVYKDRWQAAKEAGKKPLARGFIKKAIAAYLAGFQSDWRDAYPGINTVTLMELADPPDDRRKELVPIVTYSVKRRVEDGEPDYWDHATLLELAVLAKDQDSAEEALGEALAVVRERWEPTTTARNLGLIRQARTERGEETAWIEELEKELAEAATEVG